MSLYFLICGTYETFEIMIIMKCWIDIFEYLGMGKSGDTGVNIIGGHMGGPYILPWTSYNMALGTIWRL